MNSQNVADALQKYNLKKTAVQKALDTLAENGQISYKEYGKQKIYLARQDHFKIPNNQELDQMKKDNSKLQDELGAQKKTISEVEAGILLFPHKAMILWLGNIIFECVNRVINHLTLVKHVIFILIHYGLIKEGKRRFSSEVEICTFCLQKFEFFIRI